MSWVITTLLKLWIGGIIGFIFGAVWRGAPRGDQRHAEDSGAFVSEPEARAREIAAERDARAASTELAEANKASHDMQLEARSGIWVCSRCGETTPGRRSCDERLAKLSARPA